MSKPVQIYTDGGYKRKYCAWAFLDIETGHMQSGVVKKRKQGAYEAELWGVLNALEYAVQQGIEEVHIYTDHAGIAQMFRKDLPRWKTLDDVRKPLQFWTPLWVLSKEIKVRVFWVSRKNEHTQQVDQRCTDLIAMARDIPPLTA